VSRASKFRVSGTCIVADNFACRNQFSTEGSQLVNLASVLSGISVIYVGLIFGPFVPNNNNNNNNNNKRQFVRRRNMSVDITRAPYRQSGNVVN